MRIGKRLIGAFASIVVLTSGSCKTPQQSVEQGGSAELADATGVGGPLDNRDPSVGGAKGSSDPAVPGNRPRFVLKADFPDTPDFKTAPPPKPDIATMRAGGDAARRAALAYAIAIQNYAYEDMATQDRRSPDRNWRLNNPRATTASKRWYHMPWLHTVNYSNERPGRGREAIWGLTRELDLRGPLHPDGWPKVLGRECIAQNWGLGFFNEPGGYSIGRVFPTGNRIDPSQGVFPVDTVSVKILFTAATPAQIPDIDGAWQINANVNAGGACIQRGSPEVRRITRMRHLQMDIMQKFGPGRDDWIFVAYVYDKGSKDSTSGWNHDPARGIFWQGMVPNGVQFGPRENETISISELSTAPRSKRTLPTNGLKGRLNGPADNPMSSCLSCHARAQWPELATSRLPFAPRDESDSAIICLLHDWGGEGTPGCPPCRNRNDCIPAGTSPVAPSSVTMDYSLQFPLALRNRSMLSGARAQ